MNAFEKRVQQLFADFRLEQYREAPDRGKFVEFWAIDRESPATTVVHIRTLKRLEKLLSTEDIHVTGGNFPQDQRGEDTHTKVLITAYGVKFPKR